MIAMRIRLLVLVMLVSVAGVARAQRVRPAVAGCYAFFDQAGRPASESLSWAPATARLDSSGRAVKLTPKFDEGRQSGPGAYRWSLVSPGDSVHVMFHNGFSGTAFLLAQVPSGDTLRGRAREYWDFGPPFETEAGPASAVRIACPEGGAGQTEHLMPRER